MAYQWSIDMQPGPDADEASALADQRFGTQAEAEQWLTASYGELADLGVQQVSLFEEDRLVYGPMSLEA